MNYLDLVQRYGIFLSSRNFQTNLLQIRGKKLLFLSQIRGNSSLLLLQIMGNNTAFLSQIRGKRGYHWDDGHNLRSQNDGLGGNSDR